MSDNQFNNNAFVDIFDGIDEDDIKEISEIPIEPIPSNLLALQFDIAEHNKKHNIYNLMKNRLQMLPGCFLLYGDIEIEDMSIDELIENRITLYLEVINNDITLSDIDTLMQIILMWNNSFKIKRFFYMFKEPDEKKSDNRIQINFKMAIYYLNYVYGITKKKYCIWTDEEFSFHKAYFGFNQLLSFIEYITSNKFTENEIIYHYKTWLFLSKQKLYTNDILSLHSFTANQLISMIDKQLGSCNIQANDIPVDVKSGITQEKLNDMVNNPDRNLNTYIANNIFTNFALDYGCFGPTAKIDTEDQKLYNKTMMNVIRRNPKTMPMKMAFAYDDTETNMSVALYIGDVFKDDKIRLLFISVYGNRERVQNVLEELFGTGKFC